MCGRLAVTVPSDAMAQMFAASPANNLPDVPNYNTCPTTQIHVVKSENGARQLVSMRWGFLPSWYETPTDGPLLINARAETISEKPAFRKACRERRCLIPVTGYYEWTKDEAGKRWPWYIHSDETIALAGIWQDWQGGEETHRTCALVTIGANETMSAVHHRMPVPIAQQDWGKWLGEDGHGAASLMTQAPETYFSFYPVDPKVNSNRASGPDLIEPFDAIDDDPAPLLI